MTILKRDGIRGIEYFFRFNGQLHVFNNKQDAEAKAYELEQGSLF